MTEDETVAVYAALISGKIMELIGHKGAIDLEELEEGDNAKHFAHALLNLAPRSILNEIQILQESEMSLLECNNMAKTLILEYGNDKTEQG